MLPPTAEILKYKRKDLEHSLSHFPIVSSANRGARQPCKLSQIAQTWGTNLCKCSPDFSEIAACLLG